MSTYNSVVTHDVSAPDDILYSLGPTEVVNAFLRSQTRIETEAALKSHILDIQSKACKVSLSICPCPPVISVIIRFTHIHACCTSVS